MQDHTSPPSGVGEAMVEMLKVPGLDAAWLSHIGLVRKQNEDAIAVVPLPERSGAFIVLSDGMGGQAGGEVASGIVRERLLRGVNELSPRLPLRHRYDALCHALLDADRMVCEAAQADLLLNGMGATVLAAAITPRGALHLYAGDSRLYHFRAGSRLYRTQDHSVVEVLRQAGRIEESQMHTHPQRNLLLSYIGTGSSGERLDVAPKWREGASRQEAELELVPGDTLLLSTDGLHSLVQEAKISGIVSGPDQCSAEEVVGKLLEAALAAGGSDNITVAVIRVE